MPDVICILVSKAFKIPCDECIEINMGSDDSYFKEMPVVRATLVNPFLRKIEYMSSALIGSISNIEEIYSNSTMHILLSLKRGDDKTFHCDLDKIEDDINVIFEQVYRDDITVRNLFDENDCPWVEIVYNRGKSICANVIIFMKKSDFDSCMKLCKIVDIPDKLIDGALWNIEYYSCFCFDMKDTYKEKNTATFEFFDIDSNLIIKIKVENDKITISEDHHIKTEKTYDIDTLKCRDFIASFKRMLMHESEYAKFAFMLTEGRSDKKIYITIMTTPLNGRNGYRLRIDYRDNFEPIFQHSHESVFYSYSIKE